MPANKPKILIGEDDVLTCEVLEELLSDRYEIVTVHDGEAVLEKIASFHPDCLIIDNRMHKLSGREVLEKLQPSEVRFKIIVTTGFIDLFEGDTYKKLGVDAVFFKPVDLRELEITIPNLLNL